LNRELVPNYKAIAARASLSYTTLSCRFIVLLSLGPNQILKFDNALLMCKKKL
jgi:hypothetical protein